MPIVTQTTTTNHRQQLVTCRAPGARVRAGRSGAAPINLRLLLLLLYILLLSLLLSLLLLLLLLLRVRARRSGGGPRVARRPRASKVT